MWKLVIIDDVQTKTVVNLVRDEYTIGRGEGHAVRLTERNISREHARVVRTRLGFRIEDRSSYNGVFVNGVRIIGRHDLAHGDLIHLGDYRIFVVDEAIATQEQGYRPYDESSVVPASGRLPHRLVQLIGPQQGAELPLEGSRFLIGRGSECELTLDHGSVSRIHAEVRRIGDERFEIVDKGSANGLRINGRELDRALLDGRDVIEIGDVVLKYIPQGQVFRVSADEGARIAALAGSSPPLMESHPKMGVGMSLIAASAGALLVGLGFLVFASPDGGAQKQQVSEPLVVQAQTLLAAGKLTEVAEEVELMERTEPLPKGAQLVAERWASTVLDAGERLSDEERRRLLGQVARSKLIGDAAKEAAARQLALPSRDAVDLSALESDE